MFRPGARNSRKTTLCLPPCPTTHGKSEQRNPTGSRAAITGNMSSDDERSAMHRETEETDGFRRFTQVGPLYELSNGSLEEAVVSRRPIITPAARPPAAQIQGPRIRSVEVPSRRLLLRIRSGLSRQRAPVITIDDDDNGGTPATPVATIAAAQQVPPSPRRKLRSDGHRRHRRTPLNPRAPMIRPTKWRWEASGYRYVRS